MHRTGAVVFVGPFLRHENQQRVGDVRHGAEQPHYHRDGNHGRQHNGQAGEKIGAPAGEMISLIHDRTLGWCPRKNDTFVALKLAWGEARGRECNPSDNARNPSLQMLLSYLRLQLSDLLLHQL